LHERRDPAPFNAPSALVRKPICSTTGAIPEQGCPAVVEEYLYPQDLAGYYRSATPTANRTVIGKTASVDATSAASGAARVRILFPRDGDEFVLHSTDAGIEIGNAQALELQATVPPKSTVRWRVNGRPIAALSASGIRALWRLRDGAWTLEASDGTQVDRVRIFVRRTVVQPLPTGFSLPGNS